MTRALFGMQNECELNKRIIAGKMTLFRSFLLSSVLNNSCLFLQVKLVPS